MKIFLHQWLLYIVPLLSLLQGTALALTKANVLQNLKVQPQSIGVSTPSMPTLCPSSTKSKAHSKVSAPAGSRRGLLRPEVLRMSSKDVVTQDDTGEELKSALKQTSLAVVSAAMFGAGIFWFKGVESGLEFAAGYLVEQSLSVDNLFVFLLLFKYFQVPKCYENQVLNWGIFGALLLRGIMIGIGVEAVELFQPIFLVFAAVLAYSSYKILAEWVTGEGEEEEDLEDNAIIKLASKVLTVSDEYDGGKFFTVVDGVKVATPLLLCLVCVELSDIVFAVDSVPAVFGVTKDPFIVYTSNIFAILGLRSLYTVLSKAVSELDYLQPAVGIVLGFIGSKLGLEYYGYEISTGVSLGVVAALLGGGVGLSVLTKSFRA